MSRRVRSPSSSLSVWSRSLSRGAVLAYSRVREYKTDVKEFYRTSITTDQWLEHFHRYWSTYPEIVIKLQAVKWDEWLHGEGLNLPEVVEFDTCSFWPLPYSRIDSDVPSFF